MTIRSITALAFSLSLASLALTACGGGDDGEDGVCTPGAQTECSCPGGDSGVQVCSDDGSGLGECSCDANNGGNDNGGNDNGGNDNGGNDNGGNDNGGNDNGGNDNAPEAWCCINDQFYGCDSDNDAFLCVMNFDPGSCTRDASFDAECTDDGGNGGNDNGGNDNGGNDDGSIGSECTSASDCDSAYCRESPGAFGGTCAVNDFGAMCQFNEDCEYGACLGDWDVNDFGYCTATCENFTDCPTFWDCEEVGNASGTYCIQD